MKNKMELYCHKYIQKMRGKSLKSGILWDFLSPVGVLPSQWEKNKYRIYHGRFFMKNNNGCD